MEPKEGSVTMMRFCPTCKKETEQTVKLKDPDDPESGEVWQCIICLEHTNWVD